MNNTKNSLINNRINIIYASLILLIFIKWIIRQITIYRLVRKIKILRTKWVEIPAFLCGKNLGIIIIVF